MSDNGHGNGNSNGQNTSWPTAMVAVTIVLLLCSITVTAILKYDGPDDALKIWTALSGIVGLLTGAFVTYFFTQGTVQEAKAARDGALERAGNAEERERNSAARAEEKAEALAATAGILGERQWTDLLKSNATVKKAVGGKP